MRVLVAGPYPPAPDEAASAALATVRGLLAGGHEVSVLSPLPSAAEHHGPLAGLAGALALARLSRRFDALHLQVSRRMLFRPELPQYRRIIDSAGIALALRLWKRTTADLGDLSDVPGGGGGVSGRLVWPAIGEILVADELVRNHAVKMLRFPAAKVRVGGQGARRPPQPGVADRALPVSPPSGGAALPDWRVGHPADWGDLMAQVRERAAIQRGDPAGE